MSLGCFGLVKMLVLIGIIYLEISEMVVKMMLMNGKNVFGLIEMIVKIEKIGLIDLIDLLKILIVVVDLVFNCSKSNREPEPSG